MIDIKVYCGIIVVRGRSLFVCFVGYPYLQVYVPINVEQCNELSRIVMQQTKITSPQPAKFWQSLNISPQE